MFRERVRRIFRHARDVVLISLAPALLSLGDYSATFRPLLEHYFGVDNVALVAMFVGVFLALLRLLVVNRPRGSPAEVEEH